MIRSRRSSSCRPRVRATVLRRRTSCPYPVLFPLLPLWQKIQIVAKKIYHARELEADKRVRNKIQALEKAGYGHLPVCMAKTQYSFSSDPRLLGAPEGFNLTVRDVRLAAGAEFVIVYCGDIMTMPGLPKVPTAEVIDVDDDGRITGLF